jgi:hypothetical protein
MSTEISAMIPGRPGRFGVNVHFRAISCRCPRKIVLGNQYGRDQPQNLAAESATLRREASAVVVGQLEVAPLHPRLEGAVCLHHVLDDVGLLAADHPARASSGGIMRSPRRAWGCASLRPPSATIELR